VKEDLLGLVGRVFDQLRFDELVDEGGFGYVYRGVHLGMDEAVAIKCLKMQTTSAAMAQSFEKRFKDETRMAYRLSQGNLDIVRCISSGSLMAGDRVVPYMVLEWLDGHSLRAELAARRDAGRARWSLREAVDTLDSAAQALAFAHRRGVVHRDVKPGNLFLARTASGTRAKVLDFGVAKIVDPSAFMARGQAETGTQELIASPAYGAPEQLSNEREKWGRTPTSTRWHWCCSRCCWARVSVRPPRASWRPC
jgi:serine/threonine protein kinase